MTTSKPQFDSIRGIRTELLVFDETDISPEYLSWLNNKVTMAYSNQRFIVHTFDTAQHFLESLNSQGDLFLKICELKTGNMVGTITARFQIHHQTADLGILIGSKYWNQGFGYDAWTSLMEFIFREKNVRKITAGTLSCNIGMNQLAERSQMILEAVHIQQEIVEQEIVDVNFYSKFCE
jgi:ribosomal-protein-alanine N-acetyltransferase